MFGVMGFVFPSLCCTWYGPAFLGMAEHLPLGSGEFLDLLCLCMWLLLSLINCLFLNPWVFSLLPSWLSLPSCWWLNLGKHYKLGNSINQTFYDGIIFTERRMWVFNLKKTNKLCWILSGNYIRTLLKLSTPRQLWPGQSYSSVSHLLDSSFP